MKKKIRNLAVVMLFVFITGSILAVHMGSVIYAEAAANKALKIPVAANSSNSYKTAAYVAFPKLKKSYSPEYKRGIIQEGYQVTFDLYVPEDVDGNLYAEAYIAIFNGKGSPVGYMGAYGVGDSYKEEGSKGYVLRKYSFYLGEQDSLKLSSKFPYWVKNKDANDGGVYIVPELEVFVKNSDKAVNVYLDNIEIKKLTHLGRKNYINSPKEKDAQGVKSIYKMSFNSSSSRGFELWTSFIKMTKQGKSSCNASGHLAYGAYNTGKGVTLSPIICLTCNGKKLIDGYCTNCNTGRVTCSQCGGNGSVSGSYTCGECTGSGKKVDPLTMETISCPSCGGAGEQYTSGTCPRCNGAGSVICSTCGGTAKINSKCYTCNGKGSI